MKKFLLYLFISSGLLMSVQMLKAQDLNDKLSELAGIAAKPYVKPAITGFGSNLNSGWVSQLPSATPFSFHLNLKIVAMGALINSSDKTFTSSGSITLTDASITDLLSSNGVTPSSLGSQQRYNDLVSTIKATPFNVSFSGPTIAGDKNKFVVMQTPPKTITSDGITYNLAGTSVPITQAKGYIGSLPAFPTAAPQLTIGTVFGTNLSLRFVPQVNIQNLGKLSYTGFGIIHNPSVWFPVPLPLDLGIGYFTQKLKIGDVLQTTASQFGIYASKSFFIFTPYVGFTSEKSNTSISYNYSTTSSSTPSKIAFSQDGDNKAAALVGITIDLFIFKINADYKAAKIKTVSAGITIGN
jgi:hypothetical protein